MHKESLKRAELKGLERKLNKKKQNKTKAKTRKLDGLLAPITPHCLCPRKNKFDFWHTSPVFLEGRGTHTDNVYLTGMI